MSIEDSQMWYFDSGATKHITSQHDIFSFLESAPTWNTITCADNSMYRVKGVGTIVLSHLKMPCMFMGSRRICCQFLHLLDLD